MVRGFGLWNHIGNKGAWLEGSLIPYQTAEICLALCVSYFYSDSNTNSAKCRYPSYSRIKYPT